MPHSLRARRTLTIERLEDRTVPAGVAATFQNGVLNILGTPGDDTIVVRQFSRTLTVDGTDIKLVASTVNRIIVDAGSGNDTVRLDSQNFPGQEALIAPAVVYGGNGDDTIYGTNRGDQLYGQNGNDSIRGGDGRDYITGGDGNDTIDGAGGDDQINGQANNDSLTGGTGNDTVYGDTGDDAIEGGAGDDRVFGDAGNDRVNGQAGNDLVNGGAGDDYLEGGAGDDQIIGGLGRDAVNGGDGFDTFQDDYTAPLANASSTAIAASIASKKVGDSRFALPDDIHQQIADTCSLLASLASFARSSSTDLAERVKYDSAHGQYLVPLFVNERWTDVPVSFNGTWTDNEPYPGSPDTAGARDYWPVVYQRAFLQAQNVDTSATNAHNWSVRGTSASQLTQQRWRYPEVALRAVTGRPVANDSSISDGDLATIESAVRTGGNVIANTQTVEANRYKVDGTGLVFSHTYAIVDVGHDQGDYLLLRNPWGIDGSSAGLGSLSAAARAAFTGGNETDGLVRVSWATFKQAFATVVYEQSA